MPTYEELLALVASLREEVAALRAENVELRARLGKNSQNSSKPPSSDPPGAPREKRRRRRRRKRGGQAGHERHEPPGPAHVDQERQYRAKECQHCHASLADGKPTGTCISHFVYELPEIQPKVTDHQCLDIECAKCGRVTPAKLPEQVPTGSA